MSGFYVNCPNEWRTSRTVSSSDMRLPAFAFDIDGVLLRGRKAIPNAASALRLLQANKVPFILMTNGGGMTEAKRMNMVAEELGVPLRVDQLVQSHTPIASMGFDKAKRVLVVGGHGDSARECAESYGFQDVIMPVDLVKWNPLVLPHHLYLPHNVQAWSRDISDTIDRPVSAVMVFNDPRDMNTDMQVVQDILNSKNGLIGTFRDSPLAKPLVPIVFSNNDFVWANDYPIPRFGQGMLRMCVERVWKEINGVDLTSTILGKPFKVQYEFAEKVLRNQVANVGGEVSRVYMVGDNPALDIAGANGYGWESILVRTGVYQDKFRDSAVALPTFGTFDDVLAGVEAVMTRELK